MPSENKKFLVIGLGSMGKRRIRNLLFNSIDKESVFGFDLSADRTQEVEEIFGIKTYNDLGVVDNEVNPDVYIISTPPHLHHQYFLHAAKKKKHFFVEATTSAIGYQELYLMLDNSFVGVPSCTFRYFPGVLKIKELLANGSVGKPLCFTHYLGQYLPDWHPYEDYRKVYFAQKETGGAREMFPYELIWLTDIFDSKVKKITGLRGKVSDLEITADDIYLAVLELENNIMGSLTIDLLNRRASRSLQIIGTEGTLEWDWLEKIIKVYSQDKKEPAVVTLGDDKKIGAYNTGEEAYEAEIKDFLQAIDGKKVFPYTFVEDEKILSTLDNFGELK